MEEKLLEELREEIATLQKRVDELERADQDNGNHFGASVWVLVPVVAIIMWGLVQIFGK